MTERRNSQSGSMAYVSSGKHERIPYYRPSVDALDRTSWPGSRTLVVKLTLSMWGNAGGTMAASARRDRFPRSRERYFSSAIRHARPVG